MPHTLAEMAMAIQSPEELATGEGLCPDGGRCHGHSAAGRDLCKAGTCYRVHHCGPMSGVYQGDMWPDVVADRGARR